MDYNKFILFGDSITQYSTQQAGYTPFLTDKYVRKLDVLNRGYAGYTTEHGRLILPKILEIESNKEKDNIKLITIFLGTNDCYENNNWIQPTKIERTKENIEYLIDLALSYNIKPIVIGPGLHDYNLVIEKSQAVKATNNRRNLEYSEVIKSVAKAKNVPFIDTWNLMLQDSKFTKEEIFEDPPLEEYLIDGIHYTTKSYVLLTKEIYKTIEYNYPELLPENLPFKLSYWRDIDPKNLDTIFTNTYKQD
ncbi:unnamed protein product [Candida verbasci]|uniref:SGNH hydrolase-type esterase domain-containing protein n=1 Tax=Candida verbasci TaxID=1227364 RepID=A0A9W4XBN1_9ASCO|nr:unnamed protein product [Candida verbasci]